MDAHDDLARATIDALWGDRCRFGLVETPPTRPGRGRTAGASNRKGRRREERSRELDRFDSFTRALISDLRIGRIELEAARREIERSGYADALRLAGSKAEMVESFAAALRDRNNAWLDIAAGPVGEDEGALHLRCWRE